MRLFASYLRLSLRRAAALAPTVLLLGALLLSAVGLLSLARGEDRAGDASRRRIQVGLAGDLENRWLRLGLSALEQMDLSRWELSLERMEEAEARRALREGSLDAYVFIPPGYVEALALGTETEPLRFVTVEGGGVGRALTQEIARGVAGLLVETEGAVYALQDYVAERLPGTDPYAAGDALVYRLLTGILARDDLYSLEFIGPGEGQSFFAYWAGAAALLLLLLWGLACAPLCFGARPLRRRLLLASGLGSAAQVLAEDAAYLCLAVLFFLCAIPGAAAALSLYPSLAWAGTALRELLPRLALPLLAICAGQLLLFELVSHPVGGLLFQFTAALAAAYLAGCFYPRGFLPDTLAELGGLLPAGLALDYLNRPAPGLAWGLAAWALAFFAAQCLLRRLRLSGAELR